MRRALITPIVALALTVAGSVTLARQPREIGGGASTQGLASAVLSGTLLTSEAVPRPVRRAVVRVVPATGGSARLAGTDDNGRFVFGELPAGTYALSATKPGFVQAFHGATRPGRGPGVPIAIAGGERLDVTLAILPGAVITGLITDSHGRPASGVPVVAVGIDARGSGPGATAGRATSDDRGEYRIFGLAPGQYVLAASPQLGAAASIQTLSDQEIQWARALAAPGSFAGAGGSGGVAPPAGRAVTVAPVFYPGVSEANGAVAVPVAAGEERRGVSFSLRFVPTARLAGTMVDQNGQSVPSATVTLHPTRGDRPGAGEALAAATVLQLPRAVVSPPAFSMTGVTPGQYTLVARTGSGGRGTAAAPAPTAPPLWSVTDVAVDGWDQTDLVLQLRPGASVSGTIAFERTHLAPPEDKRGIIVSLRPSGSMSGVAAPSAVVTATGAFRFPSVMPGAYRLQVTLPVAPSGGGWTLKSAALGDRDLADLPIDLAAEDNVPSILVTLTDRAAEVAGRLVDTGGRPVTEYSIVVFTTDRSLWLPDARRIQSTRPATDGTFSVTGLPAGDYAIAAVMDAEGHDLSSPAVLSQLLAGGHRVTLAEGERKTQDLGVAR